MSQQKQVSVARLERIMQIIEDTKKDVFYNKSQGVWMWCDRDERDAPDAHHGPFSTFLEAASDSIEPYL